MMYATSTKNNEEALSITTVFTKFCATFLFLKSKNVPLCITQKHMFNRRYFTSNTIAYTELMKSKWEFYAQSCFILPLLCSLFLLIQLSSSSINHHFIIRRSSSCEQKNNNKTGTQQQHSTHLTFTRYLGRPGYTLHTTFTTFHYSLLLLFTRYVPGTLCSSSSVSSEIFRYLYPLQQLHSATMFRTSSTTSSSS